MKIKELIRKFSQKNLEEQDSSIVMNIFGSSEPISETTKTESIYHVKWDNVAPDGSPVAIRKHPRFTNIPNHHHDFIELQYVLQGQLSQTVGGQELILEQGHLLFLNKNISHSISSCGQHDLVINFLIKPNFLSDIFDILKLDKTMHDFFVDAIFSLGSHALLIKTHNKYIDNLFKLIFSDFLEQSQNFQYKIKCYFSLLILAIIDNNQQIISIGHKNLESTIMLNLCDYLEQNLTSASLSNFAKQCGMPTYYLSRLIKTNIGLTFTELLHQKKLDKACLLLKTSSKNITMICNEVGYNNWNYFYNLFKAKLGQTPAEYRKNKHS